MVIQKFVERKQHTSEHGAELPEIHNWTWNDSK